MIARHLTHEKHVVGKSVENVTIENMLNNNLRHTHEMHQSLMKDKIIHIMKERSVLKARISATTSPNHANEANASDCKSLIRNEPRPPSSNTKSNNQNKKCNEDSNNHGLFDARDDDEEKQMLFCKK